MSKFDQLSTLGIARAETTLLEAQGPTYYGLNPEFDSSKLTGFDQLVANFVETKAATADEIVDVIQRNSENPDDRTAALEVFRNIIDSNIVVPSAPPEAGNSEEAESEPDEAALAQEPEVKVDPTEPVVPATADEEEDEEEKSTTAGAVPPPEEDEADTFEPAAQAKSRVADVSPEADELEDGDEDLDDTPTSELVKKDKAARLKKQQQAKGLVHYLFSKRGKSPEEADAYFNQLAAQGKV